MKSLDSLHSGQKHIAPKSPRPRASNRQKQVSQKNKIMIFWALVAFSAGVIFISWLFFLKVEIKDASRGGAFGDIFSGINKTIWGIKESVQEGIKEAKNLNLGEVGNNNINESNRTVSPEVKKLEEQVFPEFTD